MSKTELIAILDGCTESVAPPDDLTLIRDGRFTAVLTSHNRAGFSLLHNRRQVLLQAAKRQAQLENCMGLGTVLPVRPGCVFDQTAIQAFVAANEDTLAEVSARLEKSVQYQVTVSWKASGVLTHFRETPEIACLFSSSGVTSLALHQAISKLATRLEATMRDDLHEVSQELLALPITEDVLLNVAILLRDVDSFNLDQALEQIDAIWSDGFSIRQIGPAPASSFALLDPIWTPAEHVREAHVTLGVAPGVCPYALAEARRAALMQPGCDVDHVRTAAKIVRAATRLGTADEGVYLCAVRSDDQSEDVTRKRAVA